MNYPNFTFKLIAILASILFFNSCSKQQSTLRLVFPNKVNYESFILAKENGFFNEAENSINIQTVNSGIHAAEAFNTGSADLIATGNGPAVIILSNRKDAVIVTRYATGEKMHRMVASTEIKSIEELKGKRIGVQQGSSTHATLLAWLPAHNIPIDSVILVPMQPSNMPEAMKNKQLDAIAGSEPWGLNVEKLCGDNVYELSNLEDSENVQSHVIITTRKVYIEQSKQIEAVLDGLERANKVITNRPDRSAALISKQLGLTVEEQKICTSRLTWELGWTKKDTQSLEKTAETLFNLGSIKSIPNIQDHLAEKK